MNKLNHRLSCNQQGHVACKNTPNLTVYRVCKVQSTSILIRLQLKYCVQVICDLLKNSEPANKVDQRSWKKKLKKDRKTWSC